MKRVSIMDMLSRAGLAVAAAGLAAVAAAAPTDDLRTFVRSVKSGKSTFTQTVTAPGGKQKTSNGSFEFERPNRFRFVYDKPYAQTIVGDGTNVWLYDPDLNQVSSRAMGEALGATPAALLVSPSLDEAFTFADQPAADGLQWVQATPKQADGTIRWLKVGFKDHAFAALEIADSFGQRSRMTFNGFQANAAVPDADFVFVPPRGADVVRQ
jgi:outer membrane lipoprotein carrier protein